MDKNKPEVIQLDGVRSNWILSLLLLAYILSFIDRNVMSLLVGPIRQEFDISDFEYSLLHGLAFTMLYILLGLPFGWLADRSRRKWIISRCGGCTSRTSPAQSNRASPHSNRRYRPVSRSFGMQRLMMRRQTTRSSAHASGLPIRQTTLK